MKKQYKYRILKISISFDIKKNVAILKINEHEITQISKKELKEIALKKIEGLIDILNYELKLNERIVKIDYEDFSTNDKINNHIFCILEQSNIVSNDLNFIV